MILKNEKLEELEEYCLKNPIKHAFTIWDIRKERENTDFYIYFEKEIRGYMLIFRGTDIPSIIIHGDDFITKKFLGMIKEERCIIHMPYDYITLWKGGYKYGIYVMTAKPKFYGLDDNVKEIKDVTLLKDIFLNPEYLVNKARTFGFFYHNKVVSVSSALVHMPEVWILGAVYTRREYRNRGFATRVIGHFMSIASKETKNVVLWVRSDNKPAINLYKKYSFRIIGKDSWISVGINIPP